MNPIVNLVGGLLGTPTAPLEDHTLVVSFRTEAPRMSRSEGRA
jgi:hypothetical protein